MVGSRRWEENGRWCLQSRGTGGGDQLQELRISNESTSQWQPAHEHEAAYWSELRRIQADVEGRLEVQIIETTKEGLSGERRTAFAQRFCYSGAWPHAAEHLLS